MLNRGVRVRQIMPAPVEGVIDGYGLCQETGKVSMKVVWVDADGNENARFFSEEELEEVKPEEVSPAVAL